MAVTMPIGQAKGGWTCPAAHLVHRGSYEGLPGAWQTLFAWCTNEGLQLAGINWEIYRQQGEDPAQWETALYALLA